MSQTNLITKLLLEQEALYKEISVLKDKNRKWKRIGTAAFEHSKGCLDGCRRACMCTCGYEHYVAQIAEEQKND